jgi:hypothetical protein
MLGLCYHGAVENQLVQASVDYGCEVVKNTDASKTASTGSRQVARSLGDHTETTVASGDAARL